METNGLAGGLVAVQVLCLPVDRIDKILKAFLCVG